MMTVGSLFAGIGGFDLGFERAGFETKWQVEIEPFCNKVLERHFPKAKRYGDITKLDPAELEKVDVITGGFPCQDLSVAGKRKGLSGERSGLFYELKRIVAGVRPAWIVVENVPGLFSSGGGKDFGLVLFHLAECGYGLAWRVLDSRYFGVAQRRRRVFIVGRLGGVCPPEILFESEGVRRDSAKVGTTGCEVARSVGTSTQRWKPDQETFITGTLQGGGKRGYRLGAEECRDGQIFAFDAFNNKATKESASLGQNCGMATGRNLVSPPLYGSGAGTERTASAGNEAGFCIIPETAPTLHEGGARDWNDAERGFQFVCPPPNPDGMRTAPGLSRRMDGTPDGPRYRALGNAVTVNVAEWIAKRIMRASK